ncbi:MAG TPA: OsmC family protein [Longimicrobiales bacterium]|nr:OsmC family protein [Longimicrobiales bacterium]
MTDQNTGTRPARAATITWDGGLRFTAEMRGHSVPTDQPVHAGGADSAIMPLELLAASLGTCVALYAHQFCAARQIPVDGLGVEVSHETAKAPKRIGRFDVVVRLPDGFPDEYRAAAERAVRACPVHNTLSHPPEINIDVQAPAVASAV